MHGAPPVQMACGRDARVPAVVGLLAASAAACLLGWWAWHAAWPATLVVPGLVVAGLLGAGAGWRLAAAERERRLVWDGRAWALDGRPGDVAVMIDIGDWMLLRVQSATRSCWLPLSTRRCGAPAHLARAALHAHAGRASLGGAAGSGRHG